MSSGTCFELELAATLLTCSGESILETEEPIDIGDARSIGES